MKNQPITQRGRNNISFIIAVIAAALIITDYKVENISSNPIQWGVLLTALFAIMYFQFFYESKSIEYTKDEYPGTQEEKAISVIQKFVDSEEDKKEFSDHGFTSGDSLFRKEKEFSDHGFTSGDSSQPSKARQVLIVQPMIVVSDSEFEKRTSKPNEIENEQELTRLDAAPNEELPVCSYSNHGINKKHRAMFDDINSFAIGTPYKTEAELHKKLLGYGYPFKVIKKGNNLVAFDFGFIRMPTEGYFGVNI